MNYPAAELRGSSLGTVIAELGYQGGQLPSNLHGSHIVKTVDPARMQVHSQTIIF